MPNFKIISFFLLFVVLFSCKPAKVVNTSLSPVIGKLDVEPVIFSLGIDELQESDIHATLDNYMVADSLTYSEIVEEILYQKRLYKAASEKGYTKDSVILEEVNSYLGIVAESFLEDSSSLNELVRLSYKRMQKELNASHILIPVSLFSSPQDTLRAFNEITKIQDEIANGLSFDSLAFNHSGDINTKYIGGNMGWFSALQFLFPIEEAAYQTEVGNISNPIRTKAGYHLIKVIDGRDFSGTVSVEHILKATPINSTPEFIAFQKNIMDSLYQLIENGASFETICENNSDDTYTKNNKGLLTPFTIGSRQEKSFEEMAFSLNPNEVSIPFKTDIGWHLVKLIEKRPLASYEDLKDFIINKVKTDSRGEYLKSISLNKYSKKLDISEDLSRLEVLCQLGSKAIENRSWKVDLTKIPNSELLSIAKERYTSHQFLKYALDKQSFDKQYSNFTPDMYLRKYYQDFKNDKIHETLLNHLPTWNTAFRLMADGYVESLIINQYLNDVLYTRSVSDTLGQKKYYREHLADFQLPKKAKANIIQADSVDAINKYVEIIDGEKPYRLKRGIRPIFFYTDSAYLDDDIKKKLIGLTVILENNPSYVVEIGGHRDINEEIAISYSRIDAIVNFLKSNGVNITRIREYDYGTSKLADRFDWTQNQRASFQFFTSKKMDVIQAINTPEKTISLKEGTFSKGENVLIDGTNWETGTYEAEYDGQYYRIEIEQILPVRNKTFKEAYGAILAGYQRDLEKQLKEELIVKYPATINTEEFKKLYAKYKQKNP